MIKQSINAMSMLMQSFLNQSINVIDQAVDALRYINAVDDQSMQVSCGHSGTRCSHVSCAQGWEAKLLCTSLAIHKQNLTTGL